jgi:hypothetical protein
MPNDLISVRKGREVVEWRLLLILVLWVCSLPVLAQQWKTDPVPLWWSRFPRPKTVIPVGKVPSLEMGILLQSLIGLTARESRLGRSREMIWYPIAHPAYLRWFEAMIQWTGAKVEEPKEVWDLVADYHRRGLVKGYILYRYDRSARTFHQPGRYDPSVNVATALCGVYRAVLVSEGLEEEAKKRGWTRLLDARGLTEEECFERFRARFSRNVVAMIEPKLPHNRAEAIALDAFVLTQPGPLYEKTLAWLHSGSPVLGWGLGDEYHLTEPATRWGHFQTATNWCLNLPLLSTETPGDSYPAERLRPRKSVSVWDMKWEENVHYAAFVMTDGDNVQWLMGDFVDGPEKSWWASSERGKFAMGWTFCYPDLAQLCPYTLDYLYETASPGDDLILMGGGYYYPDLFGASRPDSESLRLHARRLNEYQRLGRFRAMLFNASRWDSPAAHRAYETIAREIPGLYGILTVQYTPYTAGRGAVHWVSAANDSQIPVISARFALWNNARRPGEGSPAKVAEYLNAMPHEGAPSTEDRFSWVTVHAWSWFREQPPGDRPETEECDQAQGGQPGTGRGLLPVAWCVRNLKPHVRVVTPTELILLLHLRMRPRQMLERELNALADSIARHPYGARRREALVLLEEARRRWRMGDFRSAFETGCRAARTISTSKP